MAAPKLDESTDLGIEKAPRSKWLLVAIVVAVLMVVGGGGAAAWFFLFSGSDEVAEAEGKTDAKAAKPKKGKEAAGKAEAEKPDPIYHPLDPAFVANLPPGGKAKMLQVAVRVETYDPPMVAFLQKNDPMVRHHLLTLFGSQDAAELMTRAGRERLQAEVQTTLGALAKERGGEGKITAVYFTQFVMQ
jgi:flagellar FliL protein